jgi:hypothetical protein
MAMAALIVSQPFGYTLIRFFGEVAEAAQVTIDADAQIDGISHIQSGAQTVFVSDQTGYKFFRESDGTCVYRKTTNGGTSWNTPVVVDSQTDCIAVTVWYDRWTPGDGGGYIHISTLDTSLDDMFYNRLDTSSDTLLMSSSPVNVSTNSGNSVATMGAGTNYNTITKGTDGTVYMAVADASDSYVVECSTSCNLTTGWTETGTNPMDLANDYNLIVPMASGNIMLINRDIDAAAEDIRYKVWNNTAWTASWTLIDGTATDNTTYDVGLAAVVSSSTPGRIFLAYTADNATLGTDDDVRTAYYNGSTWASTTAVVSNLASRAITGVAIALDASNDDVYVGYSARTTAATAATGNIYWKKSADLMQTWGTEQGPVNSSADDFYGIDLNARSDQRIYATWFDNTDDDIIGDTIADVFPGVHASTTGSQIAAIQGGATSTYLGGAFVLYENRASSDVNGITITETGTSNASTELTNIKLLYEMDSAAPYDCASVSYSGSESQFGSTDTNGFSGANGVSSFTGSTVTVGTTSAMCVYVVLDVLDTAEDATTINVTIANPETDISLSAGVAGPTTAQDIASTTLIVNDEATQTHYHWRNDNGTETTATSKTGGVEDTTFSAFQRGSTARLRLGISNEGGTSTPSFQYRLEYAPTTGTCAEASGWTDVGAAGGHFQMFDSTNLTNATNTTNIAVGSGGVTDENTTFLSVNGGVRDTTSTTGGITLSQTQHVDLEYSIMASTSAVEGNTYCFRVTNQGTPLFAYSQIARAVIAADVTVSVATTSQFTSTSTPRTNFYVGTPFIITENTGSRNVTSITIAEDGTVDAETGLDNILLRYDLDTTNPYNCAGETYSGAESQFGSTDTNGFSGPNGSSTFTGSVGISTTSTLCLYTVFDITDTALNGETINIIMESPSTNVVVSPSGSVSPSTVRDLNGTTTLVGAILTQTHYHWRNDNGTETTATSKTGGVEDTAISNTSEGAPLRLRLQVSNEGSVTAPSRAFRLEYGTRISSCSAVGVWTDVGALDGAWDMYDSSNLTDGANTTNIAVGSGGVTDENTTFLVANAAVKDTSSTIATTTLTSTQYLEAEFSIVQTADAGYDVPYCFRLAAATVPLNAYTQYAELTTAPERDFEIQRGTFDMTGTTQTLTAGVDYVAPAASTSAFMRITNTHHTGAGLNALGGNQNADDVAVYIQNPSNILTSVTFTRIGATGNTRVYWEIVEFIGTPGSDNEMIVRSQSAVTYGATNLTATGTASGIVDDADVVVFITGQATPDTGITNYNSMQSTAEWNAASDVPVFTRGVAGSDAVRLSYAVVEFTGLNWYVQRSQHTYTSAGTTETESITPVNSLSRTFLHTQKRVGNTLTGMDEFGAEVWLSSIGQVSYFLQSGATTPTDQTSVAWIIENVQTNSGAMEVTRSNGTSNGGTEPLTLSVSIGKTLSDLTNASIFVNNRAAGTGTNYPRPIIGATIASSTHYTLWRSDTGSAVDYRTEIVEWPTAGLAIRQHYYRVYADNGLIDPTDPWPPGASDLGENAALTGADEPLGESERLRVRVSLRVSNATFPAGTKAFRLQYGKMTTTCSAIAEPSWSTLGNSASSSIWRGYDVPGLSDGTLLSGDPPTVGDLNLSVSDVAGTYEEANDTGANTFSVDEGDDIEYDWIIEQNGADAETYYCFRMVESDGTPLAAYSNYPQIRTASFSPRTQNWRWYDDEASVTPVSPLASENVAPVNIQNEQGVKLRVTVREIENIARDDVRFRLQYSEYADFMIADDVVSTSLCTATSTWCYVNGGGADNAVIPSSVLSDADSCSGGVGDGCGTHNESPDVLTGFRQEGDTATEYEFSIRSAGPRVNRVYYFRLYDVVQDIPVPAHSGESYPSLVTEGAELVFDIEGLTSGQNIEGVTLDVTTEPNTLHFGVLAADTILEGAHRLIIDANGTEGYTVFMSMDGELMNGSGAFIHPITGTNAAPVAWSVGCAGLASSCFGYHVGDDTLDDGSTRFAAADTYAAVSTTTLDEVAHSATPVSGETNDVVYRILRRALQGAGEYEARIHYISVPEF